MGKLTFALANRLYCIALFIPLAACTVDLAAGNFHLGVDPTTPGFVTSEPPAE
jgi:hypothetical protein